MNNNLVNEQWEVIKDFPMYEVSSLGRVKSHYSGKILKPLQIWNGYLIVTLCKDSKKTNKLIHRLVGMAFIPNPDNLPCIDHKDSDRTNNCVDNLRWCSRKDNANYDNHKPLPDELKARYRESYYRNRESRLEYQNQYNQINKEHISEQLKQYYQANRESKLEYLKQYYQKIKQKRQSRKD